MIAIDWSGAALPALQRRAIAWAECDVHAGLVRLSRGQTREQVEQQLIALAGAPVVAALDFSFSLPAWFLEEHNCGSAPALWALAAAHGEQWLREPHPHFWGRARGSRQPGAHRGPAWLGYRECERATPGRLPASTFQIGGAGAPGTGSVRGMPMLARLRSAGWAVWPFDAPCLPMVVEIYPRLLTGPVVKSSGTARSAYLAAEHFSALPPAMREEALASEDAFDALVSATVMCRHADEFTRLPWPLDSAARLEGAIWRPARPVLH